MPGFKRQLRDIRILSKKYDGTLRDEYDAQLHSETAEQIVVFVAPSAKAFDHRKQAWFTGEDGLLELLDEDEFEQNAVRMH